MSNYKNKIENPIPLLLLVPTWTVVSGIRKKTYLTIEQAIVNEDNIFYGSFKTFGGTERNVNGVYSIEDTANVETWFRPDIVSDCRIATLDNNAIYDILGEPEDINKRHQFLKFKVHKVKGNA